MAEPSQHADPNPEALPTPSGHVGRWAHEYADDLRRFLAKRRIIESDIKDICQEVYLRLLRFDRAETVKNPVAYLFRVASNVVHDFKLRQAHCMPLETQHVDNLSSELTAEELADTAARRNNLLRAIEALPPLPRAALALQASEDLSHEEIAQRLGISRRAVRKAVARGHELLRAVLARDSLI